jgi:hypothetical protein
VAMGATAMLTPVLLPASILQSPITYGAILAGTGTAIGMALAHWDQPTLAIGIGFPIFILGAFSLGTGVVAKLSAPADAAPKLNPNFGRTYEEQQSLLPVGMGAVASYESARNMGAVFPYGSIGAVYPGMAAVEAIIGDRYARPNIYPRAGYQLGAR